MKHLFFSITVVLALLCSSLLTKAQPIVAENAESVNPVLTGTTIPDVTITALDGSEQELRDLVSQKPTVLIFYRGGWCPFCNRHLAEVQKASQDLTQMGYQIIGISPDKAEFLRESTQKHNLSYSLVSDSRMAASKAFGLAYKMDKETIKQYKANGLDLAERTGNDHYMLPVPALYLVNPDGLITFQYVNPNYRTRIKSEVLLTAAQVYLPESASN
ncbi:peroxiredoxin-like family protein [Fodinibius salsisoli]|uniref:thioredoxin-dependent peroxiredoxin n=1 Tax=Fodinibius salsisoli TaxID=2820877 RepID=A0ABT3PS37_9BACT|nr:peroxiredoxin-like family protein [Fodinibius salsisoli]MCW9708662.1 AhpC/TSA family protein [Fodinibius salsisoli]